MSPQNDEKTSPLIIFNNHLTKEVRELNPCQGQVLGKLFRGKTSLTLEKILKKKKRHEENT